MALYLKAETPSRQRFAVATYRTGAAPPAQTLPGLIRWRGGWWFPGPLGYLANRTLFRGRWSVRVAPQGHGGPSWTVRVPNESAAAAEATRLKHMIDRGSWEPDLEPVPHR